MAGSDPLWVSIAVANIAALQRAGRHEEASEQLRLLRQAQRGQMRLALERKP